MKHWSLWLPQVWFPKLIPKSALSFWGWLPQEMPACVPKHQPSLCFDSCSTPCCILLSLLKRTHYLYWPLQWCQHFYSDYHLQRVSKLSHVDKYQKRDRFNFGLFAKNVIYFTVWASTQLYFWNPKSLLSSFFLSLIFLFYGLTVQGPFSPQIIWTRILAARHCPRCWRKKWTRCVKYIQ